MLGESILMYSYLLYGILLYLPVVFSVERVVVILYHTIKCLALFLEFSIFAYDFTVYLL